MNSIENLVWVERYRPSKVDDIILPANTKNTIKQFIKSGNVPNMLFHGTAGVGKTTLARAIANEIDADLMFINASKDNGIDILRTKIQQFASTVSLTGGKKMVVLDESDHLTTNAQPAFRAFLEEFTNCIFVFTCNYKNRLIDPLISRLTLVDFSISKPEKAAMASQMLKRSIAILDENGITYEKPALAALITKYFPDFRKTISELQRHSTRGVIDNGVLSSVTDEATQQLFSAIKSKNFKDIRQWVSNTALDPTNFFRLFFDNATKICSNASVPQLILLIGEYQFRAAHSIDQEINQVAFILEIMRSCQFGE